MIHKDVLIEYWLANGKTKTDAECATALGVRKQAFDNIIKEWLRNTVNSKLRTKTRKYYEPKR